MNIYMNILKKIIFILSLLLAAFSGSTYALDTTNTYKINIICNKPGARVFIDYIEAGNAPLYDYLVKPGNHTLMLLISSDNQWEVENYRRNIDIISDTTIGINFERFYVMNSDPFNAKVFLNDTLLGYTPLRLYREWPISGKLTFKKDEYLDETRKVSSNDTNSNYFIKLKEVRYGQTSEIVFKNRKTDFKTKRDFLAIGSFGAGALLSGISAIYHKNVANDSYEIYRQTLNPADLNKTNRNDTFSLISLLVMQGAIAGVIYFLFFD